MMDGATATSIWSRPTEPEINIEAYFSQTTSPARLGTCVMNDGPLEPLAP